MGMTDVTKQVLLPGGAGYFQHKIKASVFKQKLVAFQETVSEWS